jgi:hypothetical protein
VKKLLLFLKVNDYLPIELICVEIDTEELKNKLPLFEMVPFPEGLPPIN